MAWCTIITCYLPDCMVLLKSSLQEYLNSRHLEQHENKMLATLFSTKEQRKRRRLLRLIGFLISKFPEPPRAAGDVRKLSESHLGLILCLVYLVSAARMVPGDPTLAPPCISWWNWIVDTCLLDQNLYCHFYRVLFDPLFANARLNLLFFLSYLIPTNQMSTPRYEGRRKRSRKIETLTSFQCSTSLAPSQFRIFLQSFKHARKLNLNNLAQAPTLNSDVQLDPTQGSSTNSTSPTRNGLRQTFEKPKAAAKDDPSNDSSTGPLLFCFLLGIKNELLLQKLLACDNENGVELRRWLSKDFGALVLNASLHTAWLNPRIAAILLDGGVRLETACIPVFTPSFPCSRMYDRTSLLDPWLLETLRPQVVSKYPTSSSYYNMTWGSVVEYWCRPVWAVDCHHSRLRRGLRNFRSASPYEYPIHSASILSGSHLSLLERLLRLGEDPNKMLGDGSTPLHFAAVSSDERSFSTLLAAGAIRQANYLEQFPIRRQNHYIDQRRWIKFERSNSGFERSQDKSCELAIEATLLDSAVCGIQPGYTKTSIRIRLRKRKYFHQKFFIPSSSSTHGGLTRLPRFQSFIDKEGVTDLHMNPLRRRRRLVEKFPTGAGYYYYSVKWRHDYTNVDHLYKDGAQWLCGTIPFKRVQRIEFKARHTHILRWNHLEYRKTVTRDHASKARVILNIPKLESGPAYHWHEISNCEGKCTFQCLS